MKCLRLLGCLLAGVLSLAACRDQASSATGATNSTSAVGATSAAPTGSAATGPIAEPDPNRPRCIAGVGAQLATASEPMVIELYVSRQDEHLSRAADALEGTLRSLEKAASGKLSHQVVDAGSAAGKSQAKEHGLRSLTIKHKDEVGTGYFGMVFRHGSVKGIIPILSPDSLAGIEYWIASKIREVRHQHDQTSLRIGVVTGKDEVTLSEPNLVPFQGGRPGPGLKTVFTQAMPYYNFDDVDLSTDIDPELQGLVLTQAGQSFSDDELERIDAFLMEGRSLAVFASAVNVQAQDSEMVATVDTRGLDKLLMGYGIELQPALIYDPDASVKLLVPTQSGGTAPIRAPAMLEVAHQSEGAAGKERLDTTFAAFAGLAKVAFPLSSPLVLHADKQPEARGRVVARSSATALTNRSTRQSLGIKRPAPPAGEQGQQALAIVVEGKLRSAFHEGRSAEARVLVVASAQFLVNPFARAGNPAPMPGDLPPLGAIGGDAALQTVATPYAKHYATATILAFKNVLDWQLAQEDFVACSALLLARPKKAGAHTGSGASFSFGR